METATSNWYLYCYSATNNGAPLWAAPIDQAANYYNGASTPIVANGVVYLGADKCYAFNAQTGARLWSQSVGSYTFRDFAPFAHKGFVYFAGTDYKLYAFSDGTTVGEGNSTAVGAWSFEEPSWSGTVGEVVDNSGSGNHGRAFNGAVPSWDGKVRKAAQFDGTNDYVEIPSSASLQVTNSMTLMFWIKPENIGTSRFNPVDKDYGGEFALTLELNGMLNYYHGTAKTSGKYWQWAAFTSNTLVNGKWQHVTIVRDAATRQVRSYLDGVLKGTATYSSSTNLQPTATTNPVRIAKGYTGNLGKGFVDEVKLFNTALDAQKIKLEYIDAVQPQVIRIADAPALVRPLGDKAFKVLINYDCVDLSDLTLKIALMEKGDNGDGISDEIYEEQETTVSGQGQELFWLWIPEADSGDSDYISTEDGGAYQIAAWLEDSTGRKIVEAIPQPTILKWGVRPTEPLPTTLTKGQQVSVNLEWEDLYEYLPWENTPLMRNEVYPNRVAIFRSGKTEAQFPGHFAKVNQVADWLDSIGYSAGNPLDISFDDVTVGSQGAPMNWGNDKPYTTYAARTIRTNEIVSFKIPATVGKTVDKFTTYQTDASRVPVVLTVYPDNAGVPGTTPIASMTNTPPDTASTWRDFDLPNFAWTAGQTYHFVFSLGAQTSAYASVLSVLPATGNQNVLRKTTGSWSAQGYDPVYILTFTDGTTTAQPMYNISSVSISGSYRRGEVFVPTSMQKVNAVRIFMRKDTTVTSDAKVSIILWSDKSTIATATVPASSVSTSTNWVRFAFSNAPTLLAGGEYALLFENTSTSGYYYVYAGNAPGKSAQTWLGSSGKYVASNDGGAYWTIYNDMDLEFYLEANGLTTAVADGFDDGVADGWNRAAGAANWTIENPEATPLTYGMRLPYDKYATYNLVNTSNRLSYKITADVSKTVDRLYLFACKVGTSPVCSVSVYADTNGLPAGSPLASGTFTAPSTSYGWTLVDLTNFTWTAGKTYHFVVRHTSGAINATNLIRMQYVGPDTTGRKVLTSSNGGTSWSQQTYEPSFRIVYSDGTTFAQPYATCSTVSSVNGTRYGQQFAVPQAMSVSNVAMYIRRSGATGNVGVIIRRWEDGKALGTSVVSQALVPTTNSWINFAFQPNVSLNAGVSYFAELVNLGQTGSYIATRANTYGGYAPYTWDGALCSGYTTNAGVTRAVYADSDIGYVLKGTTGGNTFRASRIGNDDNIFAHNQVWTNGTASVDIRYNEQDNYFSDAELYVRYQDRNNYVKVGIRNFYAFWRLKYTVRVDTNFVEFGWICEFPKTERPVAGQWYNLAIEAQGPVYNVYFDGERMGGFTNSAFSSGRTAVGSKAQQLGIWEPQKGYYFIDDDEYSYYSPREGEIVTVGTPLDLDWGYLDTFYPTLILPSTYVMSDIEVSNVWMWITNGLRCLIATDGGIAMKNETGANDLGRIESLFGVAGYVTPMTNVTTLQVEDNTHYVTHEYEKNDVLTAAGNAVTWPLVTSGTALAAVGNTSVSAPALIVNTLTNNPMSPVKVCCFNFPVDTLGQLTNDCSLLAQRVFEWAQGEAHKVRLELKVQSHPDNPNLDTLLLSVDGWLLTGSGTTTLVADIPTEGIMTGTNLYWAVLVYPWDAADAWLDNTGIYSTLDDSMNQYVTIPGKGLQILGITAKAYAGRAWDMWAAYNANGGTMSLSYGMKDAGGLLFGSTFSTSSLAGWTVGGSAGVLWQVTNGQLRATSQASNTVGWIVRNDLDINGKNITMTYDVLYTNRAMWGGVMYRGVYLDVNRSTMQWRDSNTLWKANGFTNEGWHHVVLHIRDGEPYLRSDLFVDDQVVFLDEAIEYNQNALGSGIGFIGSYTNGESIRWDNVQITDEKYSLKTASVSGSFIPTNDAQPTFWAYIPDYDPDMWEFEGAATGGTNQWYLHDENDGPHARTAVDVYFAPRIMTEAQNFPSNVVAGQTANVPIEWEHLAGNLPAKLVVSLYDAQTGSRAGEAEFDITTEDGASTFPVTVWSNVLASEDAVWSAYMYSTSVTDPWEERIGFDDTYRSDSKGVPVEPEFRVAASNANGGDYVAYSDLFVPAEAKWYFWPSLSVASFDSKYTGVPVPEGDTCVRVALNNVSYAGWGVVYPSRRINLNDFNYLKFWVQSAEPLKIEVEAPRYTKKTVILNESHWDKTQYDTWQEVTIHKSEFGIGSNGLAEVCSPFEVTLQAPYHSGLEVIDSNTIFAIGTTSDPIRKSLDGGVTWTSQLLPDNAFLADIDMLDANTGWAVGYCSGVRKVFKTTNGGTNWVQQTVPNTSGYLYGVCAINAQTAWICASGGQIYRTTNGGTTWLAVSVPTTNGMNKIHFIDQNHGWAVGSARTVLRTTDGGTTWTVVTVTAGGSSGSSLEGLHFFDSLNGWVCGDSGMLAKTTDGGLSWTASSRITYNTINVMCWENSQTGHVGTTQGDVYSTRNGGLTWSSAIDTGGSVEGIEFLDAGNGFLVNQYGFIKKSTGYDRYGRMTWQDVAPQSGEFLIDYVRWTKTP